MKYEKSKNIRTKTTKELETKAFETLPSWVVIAKLYKRHEMILLYIATTLAFAWGFYQAIN